MARNEIEQQCKQIKDELVKKLFTTVNKMELQVAECEASLQSLMDEQKGKESDHQVESSRVEQLLKETQQGKRALEDTVADLTREVEACKLKCGSAGTCRHPRWIAEGSACMGALCV